VGYRQSGCDGSGQRERWRGGHDFRIPRLPLTPTPLKATCWATHATKWRLVGVRLSTTKIHCPSDRGHGVLDMR